MSNSGILVSMQHIFHIQEQDNEKYNDFLRIIYFFVYIFLNSLWYICDVCEITTFFLIFLLNLSGRVNEIDTFKLRFHSLIHSFVLINKDLLCQQRSCTGFWKCNNTSHNAPMIASTINASFSTHALSQILFHHSATTRVW